VALAFSRPSSEYLPSKPGPPRVEVDAHAADLVAAMNAAFDLREHTRQLQDEDDLALVARALGQDTVIPR
jgi:hypothetical protein